MTQTELDRLLDIQHNIPVEFAHQAPIPNNANYAPILNLNTTGFTFTGRELLHTIGSKTTSLPINQRDEAIQSAYYFVHLLDLESDPLHYKVEIESDLQTPRSQELGVGVMCLFAYKYFNISWDKLEPIPGPGLRFDYRGEFNNTKCIFEAKGTKYLTNQSSQINHGIEKKEAHHENNENYDIELIISTCVGSSTVIPRIVLGDPKFEFGSYAFAKDSNYFFRIRHYCRQLQACGFPKLAWYLNKSVQGFFKGKEIELDIRTNKNETLSVADTIEIDNSIYYGRWFNNWIPEKSKRYERLKKYEIPLDSKIERLQLFQGIREDVLDMIFAKNISEIEFSSQNLTLENLKRNNNYNAMVGQDGSISAFKIE